MAKRSGGSRASSSGAPTGLRGFDIERAAAELRQSIEGRRADYEKRVANDIKIIQTRGFKDMGGGLWELTSDNADVSVVVNDSPWGGKEYSINGMGATWNDGEYREALAAGEGDAYERRFSTLNAAKAAAREELENYYKKHNQ